MTDLKVTASCPACGGATNVTDSRKLLTHGLLTVRRRRACGRCGHRFGTYEINCDLVAAAELSELADELAERGQ